ncbi:RB6I2 protein, partial [Polypterus senegalus]
MRLSNCHSVIFGLGMLQTVAGGGRFRCSHSVVSLGRLPVASGDAWSIVTGATAIARVQDNGLLPAHYAAAATAPDWMQAGWSGGGRFTARPAHTAGNAASGDPIVAERRPLRVNGAVGVALQEALLAAISEKDANIALLELSSSKKKKTQDEVAALKREKDRLVQQLKQQTQNRMKLMADNYEDDHMKSISHSDQTNHKPSPDQIIPPLLDLYQNHSKLKLYIGHLTSLCQDRDPQILQGLTPPTSYHRENRAAWEEELQKMGLEQVNPHIREYVGAFSVLEAELEKCEKESTELQEYANAILQQIADHCPDILEQVVNALEESS